MAILQEKVIGYYDYRLGNPLIHLSNFIKTVKEAFIMESKTSTEQTDSQETVSVSLKEIPTDQGQALKDVARARDINQSALLREMVSASMGSILHVFCLNSQLVASLDHDMAQYNGSIALPAWNCAPPAPQFEAAYRDLLGIRT